MTRILDVAHAAGVKQLVITVSIVLLATPAGRRITADTQYDRPWVCPPAASPHRRIAIRSILPGPAPGTTIVRPSCDDEYARVVGARRDPRAHQLAHTWALGCALGI